MIEMAGPILLLVPLPRPGTVNSVAREERESPGANPPHPHNVEHNVERPDAHNVGCTCTLEHGHRASCDFVRLPGP